VKYPQKKCAGLTNTWARVWQWC